MISFIGGTGPEGKGLALRLARAGEEVLLGSRDPARGEAAAQEVRRLVPRAKVSGAGNAEAARQGDLVVVTVPFSGHRDTLLALREPLRGKVVVDTVVPVAFEQGRFRGIEVQEGSAAQQAQALLPDSVVVGAFHNLSASELLVPDRTIDADVVVFSDSAAAKARVMEMAQLIERVRAMDGGGLESAHYVENLTVLLLNINRIYRARYTIKLAGSERAGPGARGR